MCCGSCSPAWRTSWLRSARHSRRTRRALLKRYASAAILLYDSDQAGLRATFRAGDELLRHGIRVRVATLPPGEDPDTLVRTGGAAALEPIVDDAMDLIERKIQLLERQGMVRGGGSPARGARPAAADDPGGVRPIMRELYLKKVAERTGVSREVLQEQLARHGYGSPERQPPAPESRHAQGRPFPVRRSSRRKVDAAERDLLRVLMKEPGWSRTRGEGGSRRSWFETPELREVFQALTGSPETVESGLFLEHLSPGARRAWAWLDSIEPEYGAIDPDVTYADAWRALEVRPLRRQLAALERGRTKPVAALTAADLDALVAERHRLDH